MDKMIMKLLFELMKNAKRSDRQLAKILGTSQPTVTRMRNRLVRDGLIQEFTVIPNLVKLGYELFAISSVKAKIATELKEKAEKWVKKYPNVILMAKAEGMGKDGVIVSLHKDYTDFSQFVTEAQRYFGDAIKSYDTLLVSLKGIIIRPFSLRYLTEQKETQEDQP